MSDADLQPSLTLILNIDEFNKPIKHEIEPIGAHQDSDSSNVVAAMSVYIV